MYKTTPEASKMAGYSSSRRAMLQTAAVKNPLRQPIKCRICIHAILVLSDLVSSHERFSLPQYSYLPIDPLRRLAP
jgi:hypothetical protein